MALDATKPRALGGDPYATQPLAGAVQAPEDTPRLTPTPAPADAPAPQAPSAPRKGLIQAPAPTFGPATALQPAGALLVAPAQTVPTEATAAQTAAQTAPTLTAPTPSAPAPAAVPELTLKAPPPNASYGDLLHVALDNLGLLVPNTGTRQLSAQQTGAVLGLDAAQTAELASVLVSATLNANGTFDMRMTRRLDAQMPGIVAELGPTIRGNFVGGVVHIDEGMSAKGFSIKKIAPRGNDMVVSVKFLFTHINKAFPCAH